MSASSDQSPVNTLGASSVSLAPARRWAALAVLTASLLVITMDMTILNIALPEMAAELHPTSDQQLWIVDIYSLVLAGLLVSFAAIADRWGRKRMLMVGYSIFAAASLLVLFATSAEGVIAIRAILGVGGAMIMPVTLSLIRIIFVDPKERATALSIWAAVSGLGAAVGPSLAGYCSSTSPGTRLSLSTFPSCSRVLSQGSGYYPNQESRNQANWIHSR
ncbi:MFS transporter [Leucobacter coleopterorum]|uniref:MFS transporter n=1 Tax=Leucobacter coleopterorum TaxID=2714933 RepID=UPI003137C589